MTQAIPFGRYTLLERINVGGMAEVFQAKASGVEGFERLLAIKRILPNIAEDDEFITMFIDEAKISVQLQHANIAQIYDLGKIDESFFIAMEYVSGKDVRALFDRARKHKKRLPVEVACYIVHRMCEGLDYAHRKKDPAGRDMGIVHRDISPQNVLVSYDGEVKVIDFGIAKAANKASKTQAGILKGKFAYMSPEQVRGLPLDRRSDVFAVGIVFYELLCGERLFIGESDFSTLEKVRNVEIHPPRDHNPDIDDALEEILMKSLAKDIDERYQWCSELSRDLQRYMIKFDREFAREDMVRYMHTNFAKEYETESLKIRQLLGAGLEGLDEDPGSVGVPAEPEGAALLDESTRIADVSGNNEVPEPPSTAADDSDRTRTSTDAPTTPPPPTVAEQDGPTVASDDAELFEESTRIADVSGPHPVPAKPAAKAAPDLAEEATPPPAPAPRAPVDRRAQAPVVDEGEDETATATGPAVRTATRPEQPSGGGSKMGLFIGLGVLLLAIAGGVGYVLTQGEPVAETGALLVRGTPEGAKVFINGKQVGELQYVDQSAAVGSYQVRVEAEGYAPYEGNISVGAGQTAKLTAELEKEEVAPEFSSVLVATVPLDAKVELDGKMMKTEGNAPFQNEELEAGKEHTLVVSADGYRPQTFTWTAIAGENKTLSAELVDAKVKLKLVPKERGIEVTLDDEPQKGRGPWEHTLDATKTYTVKAVHPKKECLAPFEQTIEFAADETEKTIELELEKLPDCPKVAAATPTPDPKPDRPKRPRKPKPPKKPAEPKYEGTGKLLLNVKGGWAKVAIDGKNTGKQTPLINYPLPAGPHKVTLKTPDGKLQSFKIMIEKDKTLRKIITLE